MSNQAFTARVLRHTPKAYFHKNLLNCTIWEMKEYPTRLPFDPLEHVSEKVLEAVITGVAEIYAHDWTKR